MYLLFRPAISILWTCAKRRFLYCFLPMRVTGIFFFTLLFGVMRSLPIALKKQQIQHLYGVTYTLFSLYCPFFLKKMDNMMHHADRLGFCGWKIVLSMPFLAPINIFEKAPSPVKIK